MHSRTPATSVPRPRRILIVRLSHLGDVVHALPVYHALRSAHPDAQLGWAIQPEFADLVRDLPGLERVFCFGRNDGMAAWLRLRCALAEWHADWAIDAQGNIKSAAVTWMSRAARRTGLARSEWTESWGAHVLTDAAPPSGETHALARMLHLAHYLGGTERFDLSLSEPERAQGAALYAEHMPAGDGPGYVLHLAKEHDIRSWPWESYCDLAQRLASAGGRVLIIGGPAEVGLAERVLARVGKRERIAVWIGRVGLRSLGACLECAAQDGVRMIACDSGPAHVAAASGMSVTLLAGPQAPERTGPWPAVERAESPHSAVQATLDLDCRPCLARRCTHADGPVCMTALTPQTVEQHLAATRPARQAQSAQSTSSR